VTESDEGPSDFERELNVDGRLAGTSVTNPAASLGVMREAGFKVIFGIHKSWDEILSEEGQWTKINIGKKRRFFKHCVTGDCSEIVRVHPERGCGCTEGTGWSSTSGSVAS
jgi:hypothetical protein